MSSSPPLQSSSVPGFRRLVPAPVSNSESTSSGSDQGPSLLSHLRPRAKQTKIACEGIQCHYQASNWDLKRKYDEIQEKSSIYEQLCYLLTCLPEREAQGILRRLREGADVATTMRQVKDSDLPLQPAWAPETRLHYEFPYSTSMPAALLSPDNQYFGSTIFEVTSHALPLSAEQTEAWDIFLQAMRDNDTRFCSPLLVNAVLAEACHSYRKATHRAQFWRPETLGYRFLAEAKRLWELESGYGLQAFHNLRAPLIRGPPATPMPDLDEEPSWYGELWLRYPPSSTLVLMHFGYVYRAQTELRRIANVITCIMFTGQKTARSLSASELARLQKVLDDWYIGLPEPIKSHKAVLPCQLIMQAVAYALRCLETVLRLYYLRHSFEHGDTYLTYFLSILANTTIENMNRDSISPDDVKTLKILRATLLLAVKGLYDQGQHVYVSSAMCRLIRDRMTKEDMDALRRHTTWKDDQPLVPHYVRSTFPVTILMLEEDWQIETVENLTKKYNQLALEANKGESSIVITPDRKSKQAG
ncbi:hypothetical protein FOC1_g10000635 [Fusarium oxysporum f. sp. cubense race 1]|uniref:Transcription factor domain-containing protein n=1 Tax=Fusarium oxysporum f. sp. cubense (strain race 1) TaxID=1229664 RepID=N4UIJ1_FUSC1|nr:hypothetical protein FOC1_g10000635 [Fusarium oxysporum f. sp. cubense race 1]